MFIGKNLTNLRVMHGYSRRQLSEMLDVTEQAVWQYENNYTSPKMTMVNKLKTIFHVKSKYFYNPDILENFSMPNNIPVMHIAYRSKVLNTISRTQAEAKHIEFLDSFINYVTAQVSLPTEKIIRLRNKVIKHLHTTDAPRDVTIKEAAAIARWALGLHQGTNDDAMFVMEKSGIFIFEKAIGKEIDAYSLWTSNERPLIILGNMKKSAVRRNFDLAHELGHLLLHYRLEFTSLDKQEHKAVEKEANLFASTFLLPEVEFQADMQAVSRMTNPDAYVDLKEKWKTSLQVLGYRAAQLEWMDAKQHRNFYAALHRKGYLQQEPLDDTIRIQRPQKMKSIIDLVAKKELIDIRHMLEEDWMVDIDFLHVLTGIDAGFFEQYLQVEKDFEIVDVRDVERVLKGK